MSVYMPKLILFGRTRPTRGRPVTGQVPRVWQSWARLNASRLQVPGALAELGARNGGEGRPARCRVMAELGAARVRLVSGDSLSATLKTRRVSFQATV